MTAALTSKTVATLREMAEIARRSGRNPTISGETCNQIANEFERLQTENAALRAQLPKGVHLEQVSTGVTRSFAPRAKLPCENHGVDDCASCGSHSP
jgi:hypothetical protein